MNSVRVQWKAREYNERAHNADWFWTVGTIAVVLAIAALFFDNALLAVLIVVAAVALILQALKKPRSVTFTIDEKGVQVDTKRYRYQDLDSFAMTDSYIIIKSKKMLMPYLTIPITDRDRDEAYALLAAYLPEEDYDEPAADRLFEDFGF